MKKGIYLFLTLQFFVPLASGQVNRQSDELKILDSNIKNVENVINTASRIAMGKKYNAVERLLNGVYLLKNNRPQDAAALFMSLTEHPDVGSEATFYYSESMYLSGNYLVAAEYYYKVLKQKAKPLFLNNSVKRLLEISMKLRTFKGIEKLIENINEIPDMKNSWEVRYALGKYNYYIAHMEINKEVGTRNETFAIQKFQEALKYFDLFKPTTDAKGKTEFPPLYAQAVYYSGATLVRLAKAGATSFFNDGKQVLLEHITAFPSEMRDLLLFEAIKKFTMLTANKNLKGELKTYSSKTPYFEPSKDTEKEIQTLAMMAIGRIFYELGQTGESIKWYRMVDTKSRFYEDSLYEISWVYVREGDIIKAVQTLAIMEVRNKNSVFLPRAKILLGYLNVKGQKWLEASKSFNKTSLQYKRVYNKINELVQKDIDPEAFFHQVTRKKEAKDNTGKKEKTTVFKVEYDIPDETIPIFRDDRRFMKAVLIADDIQTINKELLEARTNLQIVKRRLQSTSRIGAFPLLSDMRKRTYEYEFKNMAVKSKLLESLSVSLQSSLPKDSASKISLLDKERKNLEAKIAAMPKNTDSLDKRLKAKRKIYDDMTMSIDNLKKDLKDSEQFLEGLYIYYQKLPANKKQKLEEVVKKIRLEADQLRSAIKMAEKIRMAVVDASLEIGVDDSDMKMEDDLRKKYRQIVKSMFDIYENAKSGYDSEKNSLLSTVLSLLKISEVLDSRIDAVNKKIDEIAKNKMTDIRSKVELEEANIKVYTDLYGNYSKRSDFISKVVSKESIKNIADKFQQIVMEADIGIIDVSWTKRSVTQKKWVELNSKNNKITQDLESRFSGLSKESKEKSQTDRYSDPFEEKKPVEKAPDKKPETKNPDKKTGKKTGKGGTR